MRPPDVPVLATITVLYRNSTIEPRTFATWVIAGPMDLSIRTPTRTIGGLVVLIVSMEAGTTSSIVVEFYLDFHVVHLGGSDRI